MSLSHIAKLLKTLAAVKPRHSPEFVAACRRLTKPVFANYFGGDFKELCSQLARTEQFDGLVVVMLRAFNLGVHLLVPNATSDVEV